MYGIGSALAALVVALALARGTSWWWPFSAAAAPLALLGVGAWRASRGDAPPHAPTPSASGARRSLTARELLAVGVFVLYVAGEVMTSTWMASYLGTPGVSALSAEQATTCVAVFFGLMTLTRLAAAVLGTPRRTSWLLRVALAVPIVALVAPRFGAPAWLVAAAGACGPFYPLLLARVGGAAPQRARLFTVTMIGSCNVMLVASHVGLGGVAERLGMSRAYWLPAICLVAAAAGLELHLRSTRASGAEMPVPK
jgi:fucose permease